MTTSNDNLTVWLLLAAASIWVLWKSYTFFNILRPRDQHSLRSVAILVLGDIGRSPRMMYHAESFGENDFTTYLIGYGGSKPIPALERLPKVQLRYLPEPPTILKSLPFVVSAPFKILHQIISILKELLVNIDKPPEYIMVQNPPSIPTLALVALVGRIRGSKVIIDWHNLGYSILQLKLSKKHPYVKLAKWFEVTFGRQAFAHLFVTNAMRERLTKEWDLKGEKLVLHDRPPRHFHRSSPQEKHDLFMKLRPELVRYQPLRNFLPEFTLPYSTPFTATSSAPESHTPSFSSVSPASAASPGDGEPNHAIISGPPISVNTPTYQQIHAPELRPDRPALIVSSTSWTPDEDFGVLLDALKMYEVRANEINTRGSREKLPKILVAVTGRGPERERYMAEVNELQQKWQWIRCISLWLDAQDYPVFLGSADLGVCLHSSSSALDLPMKVVDMFGCGLPVCALKFDCLDELVKDGKNGLVFNDAIELAKQLENLFLSFPNSPRLTSLTESLRKATRRPDRSQSSDDLQWCSWDENWTATLKPMVLHGTTT
uniref:Chitobiosyldiphosphodolichol beta-mannosyltransferase n=1 Tax=Moniliophthora roreri TaxID=221103 RepID=A0A0W0F9V1_MONRR